MAPKDLENQPFLGEEHNANSPKEEEQEVRIKPSTPLKSLRNSVLEFRPTLFQKIAIASILVLLISNIFFFIHWRRAISENCVRPKLIYSPAKSDGAIEYERKTLYRDFPSKEITGETSAKLDKAKHDLPIPMVIKISLEELKAIDEKSKPAISLKDGSGYIAEPAVSHELDCIKRLRRHLDSYYYPIINDDEKEKDKDNMDHCLEYLREAAMCRGDTALDTFFWRDGRPVSYQVTDHECVNWDKLVGWAENRMVNASDYELLNPGMENWD